MELRQLATFQMVATMLNFTRAADSLNYAQSTVTAQIQALETELGVSLFHRVGRRITLTEAGNQLLDYAEKLIDLEAEARHVITQQHQLSGTIRIAAPDTVTSYRLPAVLQTLQQDYPDIRIVFQSMPISRRWQCVIDGDLDFAFVLRELIESTSLETECLIPESLALVARPTHPLKDVPNIAPQHVAEEVFLLTERGCSYRMMWMGWLEEGGIRPTHFLEFDSVQAIKQCVAEGIGIAVLPQMAVAGEIARGDMIQLAWDSTDFPIYTQILWLKERGLSPPMQTFLQVCREMLKSPTLIGK